MDVVRKSLNDIVMWWVVSSNNIKLTKNKRVFLVLGEYDEKIY